MTHLEFFEFHNKHIKFKRIDSSGKTEELSGVVLDIIKYNEKNTPTEYIYIPSSNLIEWKKADNEGDISTKEKLQSRIDIKDIVSAEKI